MADTDLIPPRLGDRIILADHETTVTYINRRFTCTRTTLDERLRGCYWVVGADEEEYVVTATEGRRFVPCSNSD
jgi:hypothetical protein